MEISFRRAVVHAPISALIFWVGLVAAWAVAEPQAVILKAIVVGPFMAVAGLPFFLLFHIVAFGAGLLGGKFGLPPRIASLICIGGIAFIFSSGHVDPAFGDPFIASAGFVAALVLPWLVGASFSRTEA